MTDTRMFCDVEVPIPADARRSCSRCGQPMRLLDDLHIDEGDGGAMIGLRCDPCRSESCHYWAAPDSDYEAVFGHAFDDDTIYEDDDPNERAGGTSGYADPGDPGHGSHLADTYDAEVATLKRSFEFELCEHCGQDLDAHTFAPDVLGHAQIRCTTRQENDELSPDAARCPQPLPAAGSTAAGYQQAVPRLIAAADDVAEYRADLGAFADTLDGKRWGTEVTGPIKDMDGELVALEGDYRDLAGQMRHQGDQGAAAHEQAPWVPDDDSILA